MFRGAAEGVQPLQCMYLLDFASNGSHDVDIPNWTFSDMKVRIKAMTRLLSSHPGVVSLRRQDILSLSRRITCFELIGTLRVPTDGTTKYLIDTPSAPIGDLEDVDIPGTDTRIIRSPTVIPRGEIFDDDVVITLPYKRTQIDWDSSLPTPSFVYGGET